MKLPPRGLVGLVLLAGMALLCGGARAATQCAPSELIYVGTDATELRALRFDACAGRLAMVGPVAEAAKPRWTLVHPTQPFLYVAVDGSVIAYAIDGRSAALTRINEASAGGGGTTHLHLDRASMTLLAANFGGGSTSSIAVNLDGSLGALVSTIKAAGSGPHRRQASPHAHGVVLDPYGRHALVADMGADRVFVHGFDPTTRALTAGNAFITPPGSGPRRAVFGAGGRFVYVLNELSAELMTLRWEGQRLALVQSMPIFSPEFQGAKSASELAVSRDGRFVYAADRGESRLLVYRVNADSGELSLLQRLPSGGEAPWAFEIHPSGQWLLVANYRSNRLNLFGIDAATGRLMDTGQSVDSPAPVSVSFVNVVN